MKKLLITISLFVLTASLAIGAETGKKAGDPNRPKRAADAMKKIAEPNKAPDFTLTDCNSQKVSFSDYKGKIVVLEWLNPACPFVKYHYDKAGTMTRLAKKWADKNVVWLAIDSTNAQKTEDNQKFASEHKLRLPDT